MQGVACIEYYRRAIYEHTQIDDLFLTILEVTAIF